jgi:hypothetical protein
MQARGDVVSVTPSGRRVLIPGAAWPVVAPQRHGGGAGDEQDHRHNGDQPEVRLQERGQPRRRGLGQRVRTRGGGTPAGERGQPIGDQIPPDPISSTPPSRATTGTSQPITRASVGPRVAVLGVGVDPSEPLAELDAVWGWIRASHSRS